MTSSPPRQADEEPTGDRRAGSRASFANKLRRLLDDGTGRIHPALRALNDHLLAMPEPGRGIIWIRNNPHVAATLQGLARGEIALTHDALHRLPSPRTTAHLRDLLMQTGALPALDRQLLLLEQWALHHLDAIGHPGHERLLRQFLTWHLLPTLRSAARRGPLTGGHRNSAAAALIEASRLLARLHDLNRDIGDLDQTTLDHVLATNHRSELRRFLRWAIRNKHMPRLNLPPVVRHQRAPISQHHRLALVQRMLTDSDLELTTRVAALLVLLFAQSVSATLRLTVHDVADQPDGQLLLRLGTPPTPVPEPVATLLRRLRDHRPNMNTANSGSHWLFPGGRAGQPLNPSTLRHRFQAIGVPTTQARTAALRQLTLQAPAPVIADALGYSPGAAQHHHAAAGGTWHRYPATRNPHTGSP
jgi:hypothetical protein